MKKNILGLKKKLQERRKRSLMSLEGNGKGERGRVGIFSTKVRKSTLFGTK